jgi:hypothetical protein
VVPAVKQPNPFTKKNTNTTMTVEHSIELPIGVDFPNLTTVTTEHWRFMRD